MFPSVRLARDRIDALFNGETEVCAPFTVYAAVRLLRDACSVVMVNLSERPLTTAWSIDLSMLGLAGSYELYDAWNMANLDARVDTAADQGPGELQLAFEPYQTRVVRLISVESSRLERGAEAFGPIGVEPRDRM